MGRSSHPGLQVLRESTIDMDIAGLFQHEHNLVAHTDQLAHCEGPQRAAAG
ncbi:MAG: hypothetical protein JXX28_17625 [Deltaproteobacteria bacterium]|nr:hypothetical protein [Deltaproteobacteria bacterium]